MGIVVSDFSQCVPVSEWETGWGISGHSGDVGFESPCLTFPSAGSDLLATFFFNSRRISGFLFPVFIRPSTSPFQSRRVAERELKKVVSPAQHCFAASSRAYCIPVRFIFISLSLSILYCTLYY